MTRDALVDACVPLAAELAGAACAGHPEPLWDAHIDGEGEVERVARHTRALTFCRRCPERLACDAATDPRIDDGVRGGRVLPTIPDQDRRSPYVTGFPPEREGRVPEGDPAGALAKCGECGRAMRPKSMPRHRRRAHGAASASAQAVA